MTFGVFVALFARCLVTVMVTWAIWRFRAVLNVMERLGLGWIAGASFMTIAIILDTNKEGTPFDVWAGLVLSAGIVSYFIGKMQRLYGHELRNRRQIRAATRHLAGKGKL